MFQMTNEQLLLNNGVGVFFGILMYRMATTSIKDCTNALNKLSDMIEKCQFMHK